MKKVKSNSDISTSNDSFYAGKNTNLVKAEFTGKQNKTKLLFALGLFLGAPVVLAIGLVIAYLVYYPNAKTGDDDVAPKHVYWVSGDNIAPFVITMCLVAIIIAFMVFLFFALRKRLVFDNKKKTWTLAGIGFVASFLDAIGVGSYAVAIGLMKATKTCDDDAKISGTLTVGLVLPELIESAIFTSVLTYDWKTLLILTACAIVGGLIGSWLSNKINSQMFRFVISILMFFVGIIMILSHPQVNVIKTSGSATGFFGAYKSTWKLVVSIFVFIILGCLSSLGLGIYAPAMAYLSILGFDMTAIFPIMSVCAAGMMPPAAIKFIKDKNYMNLQTCVFNMFGGLGVLVSFLAIFLGLEVGAGMNKDTFGEILKWIATIVVFYCSGLMMYSFVKDYKKYKWNVPKQDSDILD